jgi:hypothetical protein
MRILGKWAHFCLLITLWVAVSVGNLCAQNTVQLDKRELIEVEDLSESLANALLDFSIAVRGGDLKTIRAFLADEVEALTFRHIPTSGDSSIKWIQQSSLSLSHLQPVLTQRESLIEEWTAFLNRFSEVEDVRFKVTDSKFLEKAAGNLADSEIKFFLVGRNEAGNRSWVKGSGRLHAQQKESDWEISLLAFDQIEFVEAKVDLFSEVSLPAGLSVSVPSYGSAGNDAFVYHGAAAGDINGDGFVDVVATGISNNFVYLNQGNGMFEDRAWEVGFPATPHDVTAPLLVDYDNDGDLDLFLSAVGTQMLFKNELMEKGELSFVDVSLETGVAVPALGFGATAGDVNGDGWPDLYVTSYNRYGRVMPNSWHQATNGTANLLFINQKDGTFREAARSWGVDDGRWSYAAQFVDLNHDGRQDLYVVNDFGENALYINLGTRFEDRARSSGTLDPGNGMGVSFGDYNNDGQLDLYVTNMSSTAGNRILGRLFPDSSPDDSLLRKLAAGSSLLRGESDGTFTDVTQQIGPFQAGWAWGGVFIDFDNDGWEDLYSPNGFISGESMKDT